MENETKQTNTNEQEPDIFAQKLREADSLYAILSGCTKEPYVYCDPETMDDAILLFTDEEGAKAGAQKLAGQQIPVGIAKVDRKSLLLFYTSLYTMGVNAIQVHVGEEQKMIQLTEFVRRKDPEESKNGKVWVENPELHLTMLYYMQDLRRQPNQEITPELNDLQEEIGAHFTKGRYIVPLIFTGLFLALTIWVVYRGVEKGIEKFSCFIMPGLILLVIGIAIFSLTLSYTDADGTVRTGIQGFLVYVRPDFTGLTVKGFLEVLLDAMSQLFFSLSVSMGIMVTYGSYVKDEIDLNKATNQIEFFDTGVALLSGMMIIPAVFVFLGRDGMASGPSLTFISLPKVFQAMGGAGHIVGLAFFLMLGFAALTSCVSVMETLVANCMEVFGKTRKQMCVMVGSYSLITAVLICLGYNVLYFELKLPNGSTGQLLDVMDYISNSFLMPIISFLTSILIGWVVGPKWIVEEVEKNGEHFSRAGMYSFLIRYIVPAVMLVLFLVSTGFINML